MATEDRRISGTVTTDSDEGKHRVAMSLVRIIAGAEDTAKKDRDYWLNLYAECWHVVSYGSRKTK